MGGVDWEICWGCGAALSALKLVGVAGGVSLELAGATAGICSATGGSVLKLAGVTAGAVSVKSAAATALFSADAAGSATGATFAATLSLSIVSTVKLVASDVGLAVTAAISGCAASVAAPANSN